ncbi:glycoside hydrolase family 76 protein [Mucilaginibacter sp. UR6-11]|uniref:glycoside hydrolase family 76 protein n=1 Tax=Mucilaginibacter sp. UR6-11 TaxID=1435644 RepID=UPI001E2CE6E0|nr:glycoside hydrolase family 76 protein [Mucilaginibacter sp. UR6-11]MCC8424745.1 glycoside hydrolase family 76 protein [Mucilaginibacter sp. UR6-11]
MNKKLLIVALFLAAFSNLVSAQNGFYRKEMRSLDAAIQKNFYDKTSGYYFVVLDPAQRENKNGYLREYSYLWSFCAMYQAANEIEKLEPKVNRMAPLLKIMNAYYSPAPPKPGYTDYIMKLKPGERYYDDNEWIGITALDAYARKHQKADLALGKAMYAFIMTGYDQVLGGGIYWKEGSTESKNTCSNGPGVLVALQLYQATKNRAYLDTALKIFNWTNAKLQAPSKLYYDNIRVKDGSISKPILSYNTGTMLESNVYLYEITGNKKYLADANEIADASLTYFYGGNKFRDDYWFNAVLLRAYQHLLKYNKDTKYILGFKKCLDNTLKADKNEKGLFTGRDGVKNLVDHGGMLEILARYAWLEKHYHLN